MIFIVLNYFLTGERSLKLHYHISKLKDWSVRERNWRFKNYIDHSRLRGLVNILHRNINHILVSAFVERWLPETNTFTYHLERWQSVWMMFPYLLAYWLSVDPSTLYYGWCNRFTYEDTWCDIECCKGWLGLIWGTSVRLEWLRANFSNVTDADTEVWIKCAVRDYLLYLVGCTLSSDKNGTTVSISYIRLFEDLGAISTYLWGTATLSYLYW